MLLVFCHHKQYFSFFELYFIDYVIHLSKFFSFCPPQPSTPYSLGQSSHHCSCPWIMHVSPLVIPLPILYSIFLWLFCNYLVVLLNPLNGLFTHSPKPLLPSGNHQNAIHIGDCVSVLVCVVCVLDSIVDRYVFIATLLFIVLIMFFLNKSL